MHFCNLCRSLAEWPMMIKYETPISPAVTTIDYIITAIRFIGWNDGEFYFWMDMNFNIQYATISFCYDVCAVRSGNFHTMNFYEDVAKTKFIMWTLPHRWFNNDRYWIKY